LRDRQGEDYCVGCVEVDSPQTYPPDVTHGSRQDTSTSTGNMPKIDKNSLEDQLPMLDEIVAVKYMFSFFLTF